MRNVVLLGLMPKATFYIDFGSNVEKSCNFLMHKALWWHSLSHKPSCKMSLIFHYPPFFSGLADSCLCYEKRTAVKLQQQNGLNLCAKVLNTNCSAQFYDHSSVTGSNFTQLAKKFEQRRKPIISPAALMFYCRHNASYDAFYFPLDALCTAFTRCGIDVTPFALCV